MPDANGNCDLHYSKCHFLKFGGLVSNKANNTGTRVQHKTEIKPTRKVFINIPRANQPSISIGRPKTNEGIDPELDM